MEDTPLPEEPGHDDLGPDTDDAPLAELFTDELVHEELPDTPPPDVPHPPDEDPAWLAADVEVPEPPMPPVAGDEDTPPPPGSSSGAAEEPQPPAPFEPTEGELADILPPGQPAGEGPEEPADSGPSATDQPSEPPMPPVTGDVDGVAPPPPGVAPVPDGEPQGPPPVPPGLGDQTGDPTGAPVGGSPGPEAPDAELPPVVEPPDGDLGVAPATGGDPSPEAETLVPVDEPLGDLPGTDPIVPEEPVTVPDDLVAALGELLGDEGVVTVQVDGPVDVGISELVSLLDAQDVPATVATGTLDDLQAHVAAGTPVVLSAVDASGAAAPARIASLDPAAGTVALQRLDGTSAGSFSLDGLLEQWGEAFGEMLLSLDGNALDAEATLPTDADGRSLLETLRIGAVEVARFVLLPIRVVVDLIAT